MFDCVSSEPRRISRCLYAGLIVACLIVITSQTNLAQDISWIRQFGTPGFDEAYGTAADSTGVYIAGSTELAFPGQLNAGGVDVFLRKYDSGGGVLWTVQFGTIVNDFGFDVAADGTGVYVTGQVVTGGALPGQISSGRADVFVRKYSPNGQELWTKQFGTSETDAPLWGTSIVARTTGVYVTGLTRGAFPGFVNLGDRDVFLAKLNPSTGEVVWVRQFGTPQDDVTDTLFGGVAANDTAAYVVANLDWQGSHRAVLRKYDIAGNFIWEHTVSRGSCTVPFLTGVAVQSSDVYVSGQQALDPCPGGGITPVVGLLFKHDADGNLLWMRTIQGGLQGANGSVPFTGAKGLAAYDTGVYVGGNAMSSFPGEVAEGSQGANGGCGTKKDDFFSKLDAYVRRFDFNGDVIWTRQFGGPDFEIVYDVSTDGRAVYGGAFSSCAITRDQPFLGNQDPYVIRIEIDSTTATGQIRLIVGRLETMRAAGQIANGHFKSLVAVLESALRSLTKGHDSDARNALVDFVNDVQSLEGTGAISASDAGVLQFIANRALQAL